MTLNKNLIASAVGAALTLGPAAPAQANSDMLFPYVVKDANRTTVITIIGEGQPVNQGAQMHLQYWTKDTAAANTAACQPNSSTLTFTDNDIVTFDTGALLGSGPLFGDTTNVAPLGTAISYAAPRHGYLVAENESKDSLYRGYWVEVDLANGGAHGDESMQGVFGAMAIGVQNPVEPIDSFNAFFSDRALSPGLPFSGFLSSDGSPAVAVPFWPASVASTVFTVTPLGSDMRASDNNSVVMQVLNSAVVQGAYDRNENGVDGTVPQTVRCVGRLTPAQLMPGVVANAAWAATGGWGFLTNLGDGDTDFSEGPFVDLSAAVYQVDTSNAAGSGKFLQNAVRLVSRGGVFF